jgi:rhomboid family GlyGly-CTERM serine protease
MPTAKLVYLIQILGRDQKYSFPLATALVTVFALVVFFAPLLADLALYNRTAILSGEWWRLATGHLVHFSSSHLGFDLLAILVAGILLENRHPLVAPLFYLSASLAIGLMLFFALPDMEQFGGLSGLATAVIVFVCLDRLRESNPARWLYVSVLAIISVKAVFETIYGTPMPSVLEKSGVVPVPAAHVAGIIVAAISFSCSLIAPSGHATRATSIEP